MPWVEKKRKKRRQPLSRQVQNIWLAVLAVLTLGAVAWAVAPKSGPVVPEEPRPTRTAEATADVLTFAAVGDSITEGNSPDFPASVGDVSWVDHAESRTVDFVGGWADGGAQTALMARSVKPVDADVLVLVAGTNDVANGIPFATTAQNLERIAGTVGADRVVVSAIPPQDENPQAVVAFNESLQAFAADQGWDFVDAPAGVRDGDRYAEGMTSDGTHPTKEGSRIIGGAIREALQP